MPCNTPSQRNPPTHHNFQGTHHSNHPDTPLIRHKISSSRAIPIRHRDTRRQTILSSNPSNKLPLMFPRPSLNPI